MSGLVERLRAMYSHRGDGIPTQYVNRDGPEAAARIEQLEAELAGHWLPIESAPRDGTHILAIIAENDSQHLGHHAGRLFVIRHEGYTAPSAYDMGWAVYPGYGGAPDSFFAAWCALPTPPKGPDHG